jgi:PhnB protein
MSERDFMERLDQAIAAVLAGVRPAGPAEAAFAGCVEIARRLRDLPDDRFRMRLGGELQLDLQRKTQMRTGIQTESVAAKLPNIHTITPFICVPEGEKLIELMKLTFGAEETSRHPHHGPDGFVANMRIGDSDLLIMGGESFRGQESPAALHVYVRDCDAVYQRALAMGAVTIGPPGVGEPADRPYGERAAFVSDPFSNYWFIATRRGTDYVGEGLEHVTPNLLTSKAAPLIDFMDRAFGASVEGGIHEQGGRLMHAFVRVGDVILEMAETDETLRPFGFYMHTDDVDAVYRRAMAAGAVSILPPADQPFGDRLAIVQDPAGNRWFAAKRIVAG